MNGGGERAVPPPEIGGERRDHARELARVDDALGEIRRQIARHRSLAFLEMRLALYILVPSILLIAAGGGPRMGVLSLFSVLPLSLALWRVLRVHALRAEDAFLLEVRSHHEAALAEAAPPGS